MEGEHYTMIGPDRVLQQIMKKALAARGLRVICSSAISYRLNKPPNPSEDKADSHTLTININFSQMDMECLNKNRKYRGRKAFPVYKRYRFMRSC